MDIFLSINNREQVIQLPVIPEQFKISSGMNNQVYDTIGQGEIKLIGMASLKGITLDSYFPTKDYTFLRSTEHMGWEYVNIIEAWKARRIPIRLIITDTKINMPCSIEKFEYGPQDGSGDVYYTLELSEFKFVSLEG